MPRYNQNFYEQYWEKRNNATYWNAEFLYQRSLILDIIHAIPAPRKNKIESILDVGCGNGIITALLADCFPLFQVFGLDFSKNAIDIAQKEFVRSNLIFKHENIAVNQWPYRQRSIDLITCFEVLEHLEQWKYFGPYCRNE
jgi:2-polyprenyl-3-methyl-5-hydroxy-6-metoxy-1,4-benzoquinol methylase